MLHQLFMPSLPRLFSPLRNQFDWYLVGDNIWCLFLIDREFLFGILNAGLCTAASYILNVLPRSYNQIIDHHLSFGEVGVVFSLVSILPSGALNSFWQLIALRIFCRIRVTGFVTIISQQSVKRSFCKMSIDWHGRPTTLIEGNYRWLLSSSWTTGDPHKLCDVCNA